jgi:hypothetical protein
MVDFDLIHTFFLLSFNYQSNTLSSSSSQSQISFLFQREQLTVDKVKMKFFAKFFVVLITFEVAICNRFGYSAAEQRLWKKKHEVRITLMGL